MKVALEEIMAGVSRRCEIQQVRGWKLLLLPRMLLHRPPRGGQIGKSKLIERFDKFAAGQWQDLLVASVKCSEEPGKLSRRQRRRDHQVVEANQVAKALKFVQLGELSAGRQALEGAELAPGTTTTLFNLDEVLFGKNVRSGRKGAAGGPSGMTHDQVGKSQGFALVVHSV